MIDKDNLNLKLVSLAEDNCFSEIESVIKQGANINFQNKFGKFALYFAVYHGSIKYTKLLIQYGANLNTQDNLGNTVLHISDKLMISQILIAQGADPTIKNVFDHTPYELAINRRDGGDKQVIIDIDLFEALNEQCHLTTMIKNNPNSAKCINF